MITGTLKKPSEKAKSIYLKIVGPDAQNYEKSKATILNA